MSTEPIPPEWALAQKNWPDQRIPNLHALWTQFTDMTPQRAASSKMPWARLGREFSKFAEGRSLDPRTMIQWHMLVVGRKNWYGKPITNSYVNAQHTLLKAFLRWCRVSGIIGLDPSPALPHLRETKPPLKLWTHEEYTQMIAYALKKERTMPGAWLFMLGYRTGMGLQDCCYLRWDEVVIDNNGPCYISKVRAKIFDAGERARCIIPLVPDSDIYEWMMRLHSSRHLNYKRHDGISYVHQDLPGWYECPLPKLAFRLRRIWRACVPTFDRYNPRTFRHFRNSFCSNLMNSGAQVPIAKAITGHSRVETLTSYVKPDIRALQDAVMKAQRYADGTSGEVRVHPQHLHQPPKLVALPAPPATEPTMPQLDLPKEDHG